MSPRVIYVEFTRVPDRGCVIDISVKVRVTAWSPGTRLDAPEPGEIDMVESIDMETGLAIEITDQEWSEIVVSDEVHNAMMEVGL